MHVVLINMTTCSSKSINSSILDLLHLNVHTTLSLPLKDLNQENECRLDVGTSLYH